MSNSTFAIEAGNYWIGDPCNAFPEEVYYGMLENLARCVLDYQYEIDGYTVTIFHTEKGDGDYASNRGIISVESGQIAAIPMQLIEAWKPDDYYLGFGVVETLSQGTAHNNNGELIFSNFGVDSCYVEE